MDKMKKTDIQLLMKIIALAIVCVMLSQLFPSIVFGIQQSNELQEENIITEETVEEETKNELHKDTKKEEILKKLESIGYTYDQEKNRFA